MHYKTKTKKMKWRKKQTQTTKLYLNHCHILVGGFIRIKREKGLR